MTVNVGRTQIHLGWPTAGAIVLFLVVTAWQAAIFYAGFMNSQYEMQKQLSAISKHDSLYFIKVDEHGQEIASLKRHQYYTDSLIAMNAPKPVKFYTERVINGRTVLNEVNK